MTELVFQNAMNGGVAFSAKGRGMWTVDGREDTLTDGLRFAAASETARHPLDWPRRTLAHTQLEVIETW